MIKNLRRAACLLWMLGSVTFATAGEKYFVVFKATMTETNGAGRMVTTSLTDRTLVATAASAAGIGTNGLALMYHIGGSSFGDTLDVVNTRDGSVLTTFFGLFFGSDTGLGRVNLVNGDGSGEKRVDYVYTLQSTPYTSPNSHSLGAVTTTKRKVKAKNGGTQLSIQGQNMQWLAMPQQGRGPRIFAATFQTKKPYTPPAPPAP